MRKSIDDDEPGCELNNLYKQFDFCSDRQEERLCCFAMSDFLYIVSLPILQDSTVSKIFTSEKSPESAYHLPCPLGQSILHKGRNGVNSASVGFKG